MERLHEGLSLLHGSKPLLSTARIVSIGVGEGVEAAGVRRTAPTSISLSSSRERTRRCPDLRSCQYTFMGMPSPFFPQVDITAPDNFVVRPPSCTISIKPYRPSGAPTPGDSPSRRHPAPSLFYLLHIRPRVQVPGHHRLSLSVKSGQQLGSESTPVGGEPAGPHGQGMPVG